MHCVPDAGQQEVRQVRRCLLLHRRAPEAGLAQPQEDLQAPGGCGASNFFTPRALFFHLLLSPLSCAQVAHIESSAARFHAIRAKYGLHEESKAAAITDFIMEAQERFGGFFKINGLKKKKKKKKERTDGRRERRSVVVRLMHCWQIHLVGRVLPPVRDGRGRGAALSDLHFHGN